MIPPLLILLISSCLLLSTCSASALPRKLALVQEQPLVLNYHNGPLLKGNLTVNLIWYGKFTPIQRSIIADFITSLSPRRTQPKTHLPSVAAWWQTTAFYKGGPSTVTLGKQYLDQNYSLGKTLKPSQLTALSSKLGHNGAINIVLTAADVVPDGFCMSSCGAHGSGLAGKHRKTRFAYAWVGDSQLQCPGQCAWPFHQPLFGPQTPPLVAPNNDVGVDGMIINLATVLAGAVTNPYDNGYFQTGGLEAVSACTGIFGSGAFPGYPGQVLVDRVTGASYNAYGLNGRKYLLPAMWDPKTSACKTLV